MRSPPKAYTHAGSTRLINLKGQYPPLYRTDYSHSTRPEVLLLYLGAIYILPLRPLEPGAVWVRTHIAPHIIRIRQGRRELGTTTRDVSQSQGSRWVKMKRFARGRL